MSEENNSIDEMIDETVGASVVDDAPVVTEEKPEGGAIPGLGINDLKLMANVLEVVSNRGAIKANEMAAVGTLYNTLMTFLVANGALQQPAPAEESTEESTEATTADDAVEALDTESESIGE